jgi:hypothetical protein
VEGAGERAHQHASAPAYFDCFRLFAVAVLAVTFAIFFMKRLVAEKGTRIGGANRFQLGSSFHGAIAPRERRGPQHVRNSTHRDELGR